MISFPRDRHPQEPEGVAAPFDNRSPVKAGRPFFKERGHALFEVGGISRFFLPLALVRQCGVKISVGSGPFASLIAISSAVASTASFSTSRVTSPQSNAVGAGIFSASSIISIARTRPTARVSNHVAPPSGISPIRAKASRK